MYTWEATVQTQIRYIRPKESVAGESDLKIQVLHLISVSLAEIVEIVIRTALLSLKYSNEGEEIGNGF